MSKVYRISEFKRKHGNYLDDLFKFKEGYIFIANENDSARSFLVVDPSYMIEMLGRAGSGEEGKNIKYILDVVKEKVSKKYKDIRSKR